MAALTGGDKLMAALGEIDARLSSAGNGPYVRVGFLEKATYPDGTSVAMVAAIQEFGARVEKEPGETTIYRKVNKAQTAFLRNGRFVRKEQSNFASTHYVGAHVITIPPRPFFRSMIWESAPQWGDQIVKLLKANKYDAAKTLGQMGMLIKGQLQKSIRDLLFPRLAPSTIARKGFDKPLIDTGVMLRSVDFEVST